MNGPVAQLVEQLTFNQWVAGSNPAGRTQPFLRPNNICRIRRGDLQSYEETGPSGGTQRL